ncbi:MAG: GNAT family N-acetyltransferase [Chloroflexia bacterium]|nr:GNAT family N-acetyltransferase [Chloroflexia bacterium]
MTGETDTAPSRDHAGSAGTGVRAGAGADAAPDPAVSLSPGWTVQAPVTADLERVFAVIAASDLAEFGEPDYTLDDFKEEWETTDLASHAWMVLTPDGEVAGFAQAHHSEDRSRVDSEGYTHSAHYGRGVGTALLALIEARARADTAGVTGDERPVLKNYINANNPDAVSLLGRAGFEPARHFFRMRRTLDPAVPPEPATWPEGIHVVACRDRADQERLYVALDEAFQDHWGYYPESFEEWFAHHATSHGDPALWFMALDGEEIAGIAVLGHQLGGGWVKSLAVRRPWRNRGLGAALLAHAFETFWRRGTHVVGLGVDTESPTGATRLYERAGMEPVRLLATYHKTL